MFFKAMLVLTMLTGIIGVPVRIYIGAFLLSTESVRSSKFLRRWVYRYFIFGLHYCISFLFSAALFGPLTTRLIKSDLSQDLKGGGYLLACIPLAALLYWLDCKLMIHFDRKKIEGRRKMLEGRQ